MKPTFGPRRFRQGSLLLITVVVLALVSIAVAYTLQQLQSQTRLSARAQSWNWSIALAEAGVEEGLAHSRLNYTNMISQGWKFTDGVHVRQRQLGSDFFSVSIRTNASPGPRFTNQITSGGCMNLPFADTFICRTVAVNLVRTHFSPIGLLARDGVTMKGNPTIIDSYDSRDPSQSTGGSYDIVKRQARARIGCVKSVFDLGNGNIYGKIVEGPGVLSVSSGPNLSVGSLAWLGAGTKGFEAGSVIIDNTLAAPDNAAPFASAPTPPKLTSGSTNYAAVLDNGNYMVDGNFSGKMLVRGNACLYVKTNVTITASDFITFAPGASLRLFVGGTTVTIDSVRMTPGTGTFFGLYGLPSVTSVTVATGPGSPCAINAPSAPFVLSGSQQYYGTVVCSTFTSGGTPSFHYDDALGAIAAAPQFEILSWAEQ